MIIRQQKNPRRTMNQTIAYLPGLSSVENKELCARRYRGKAERLSLKFSRL
jgi:hypothetical protein